MSRRKNILEFSQAFILDKDYRFRFLATRGFYKYMTDEAYLKRMYRATLGKELNLENPVTFNEKLQWLKLHNRRPEYTIMVDKFRVRDYISKTIGEEYLIPLLGVWNSPDEIDFGTLPNRFVLKCNHNSGLGMCICKDKTKLNIKKVKRNLKAGLANDFYYYTREWPYKDVPRKIICEKYMTDCGNHTQNCSTNDSNKDIQDELKDYKFFCFNGKVRFFKIDFDRFVDHGANYYDLDGNLLPFGEVVCPPKPERKLEIPKSLEQMVMLATKLSANHPFLRVDFYDVCGKVYFGELTFFPNSGWGEFVPKEWDIKLGEYLNIVAKGKD